MAFWQKEIWGISYRELGTNSIIALVILIIGILIGKAVSYIFDRALEKTRIEKTNAYNLFKTLIVVIKWSIYILFLNIAIRFLGITQLTSWLSDILVIIPALVGSLLLILVGFAIAVYLRRVVEESKVESSALLSVILFYFVIYAFMVFALRTVLFSVDSGTVNLIVIILTGIIAAGVAFKTVVAKKKR